MMLNEKGWFQNLQHSDMRITLHSVAVCLVMVVSSCSRPAAPHVVLTPLPIDVDGAAWTLMELIQATKDPDAKWRAVRALGTLGYKGAAPLLLECLKDSHPYVRANAARALGDMCVEVAIAPLIDLLKSETVDGVIGQTSYALCHLQAHEAVPVLKKLANHESLQTRIDILGAIGTLGSRTDVPFVAERLNASSSSEQMAAAESIETLVKVDFGFPKDQGPFSPHAGIARAKEWWSKNQGKFPKE